MKKEINVAFVGSGKHANENLYPSLKHAYLKLVAVCAKHIENAKRQANMYGVLAAYDDYIKMLDNEKIDALIVCVNPFLHHQVSMEALRRRIPVFVEKPPAANAQEAKDALELSKKMNTFLMVGFNKRFGIVYREAKNLIEKGLLSRPNSILIRACFGATRDEQALLSEIGIHYIDLMRFFFGDIKGTSVKKKISGDKITIVVLCELNDGVIATLNLSNTFCWSKPGEYIEIHADRSMLILDNCQKLIFHKPTIASPGELDIESEKSTIWMPNYSIPVKENQTIFLNGYVPELQHFSTFYSGGWSGQANIEDGFRALKAIEEIVKS